jgi:hypothetical protein
VNSVTDALGSHDERFDSRGEARQRPQDERQADAANAADHEARHRNTHGCDDIGEELAIGRHLDDALRGGQRRRKEQRTERARAPFPGEKQDGREHQTASGNDRFPRHGAGFSDARCDVDAGHCTSARMRS